MAVLLDTEKAALVAAPASAGGDHAAQSVPVALAFAHGHEWIQDEGLIGLFQCADPSCDRHAVCPGCLHCPGIVLAAPAAGLLVYWCVLHCEPHERKGAAR
jgi:hypothetical protein